MLHNVYNFCKCNVLLYLRKRSSISNIFDVSLVVSFMWLTHQSKTVQLRNMKKKTFIDFHWDKEFWHYLYLTMFLFGCDVCLPWMDGYWMDGWMNGWRMNVWMWALGRIVFCFIVIARITVVLWFIQNISAILLYHYFVRLVSDTYFHW